MSTTPTTPPTPRTEADSLKTCPNCGGLFDLSGKPYAGTPCNCGYSNLVQLCHADKDERISQLERELAEALRHRDDARFAHSVERDTPHSRVKELEQDLNRTVGERDDAAQALSQSYYLITGKSPEWSNQFGHSHALNEIDEAQALLREELTLATAQMAVMSEAHEKACQCLAFFRSVINCGESWTETCEKSFNAATIRVTPQAALALLERERKMKTVIEEVYQQLAGNPNHDCVLAAHKLAAALQPTQPTTK